MPKENVSGNVGTFFKKTKVILFLILAASLFLRVWKLDAVPVSLFSDELDVGYQAYSIIKTGRDYSGNVLPLHFQSYADARAPLYIYASIPTVAVFGITAWGVRLPAAAFGLLGIWATFLLVRESLGSRNLGLISALLMAISPWHIQYSRSAFEVTMLLAFLLLGLYFFFKSLNKPKYLWVSVALLVFSPWIYNTAKLFTPLLMIILFILCKQQILKVKRTHLIKAAVAGIVVGLPLVYATFFGGAIKRAEYLSIFTDPTTKSEVEYSILYDAQVRKVYGGGTISKVLTRLVHNKFSFWGSKVVNNYISSLSFDFLFLKGDSNLRHSIEGVGQFYKFEVILLILGMVLFFSKFKDRKIKLLILFWILAGILPAAITRDGGTHATRLIIILPPLIFLISYGLTDTLKELKGQKRILLTTFFSLLYLVSFVGYEHNYWMHNVWYSERSWQAGYKEAVDTLREKQEHYKKIILTNANDDPRIFFAAYYPADPALWQKGLSKESIDGFGELEHFDKFYFGQVDGKVGLVDLGDYLDSDTLYIASSREIKWNLAMEPQKTPEGLRLVKTIKYPSGEPAFYALAKEEN